MKVSAGLRITDIEAICLRLPEIDVNRCDGTQDALLVLVHTDEGITGIGEVDSSPLVAKAVIDAPPSHSIAAGLRHLLVGEDPLEIERLWTKMYQGTRYFGLSGPAIHALSGIDIALWDIAGKVRGLPVADLLGGVYRRKIKAYASAIMPESASAAAQMASEYVEGGYLALKFGWGPIGRSARLDLELISSIRKAVGYEIDVMIDAGQAWDLKGALRFAGICADHGIYWLEEPLAPDDLAGYRELGSRTEVAIAAGEQESSLRSFGELLDNGVDILQPDLARCGGFSAGKRIAQMAAERHRRIVPHSFKTGILVAASTHFVASIPNADLIEHTVSNSPLARDLVSMPIQFADGYVTLPSDKPGLGIEFNNEIIEFYRQ